MLELVDVRAGFGAADVLRGVTLQALGGEVTALVGANGAGKTTLLRTLSGVHPARGGRMLFAGREIGTSSAAARVALGIVQVPEGRQVWAPLTVEDNLRLGAYRRRDREIAADLDQTFALFPQLRERPHALAGTLSGGQQQMLAIGRALMAGPRLLLLDEPTMGLAPLMAQTILETVCRLRERGLAILLAEGNASAGLGIADRGFVLETGRIVLSGTGAGLLADPRVRAAYLGL